MILQEKGDSEREESSRGMGALGMKFGMLDYGKCGCTCDSLNVDFRGADIGGKEENMTNTKTLTMFMKNVKDNKRMILEL